MSIAPSETPWHCFCLIYGFYYILSSFRGLQLLLYSLLYYKVHKDSGHYYSAVYSLSVTNVVLLPNRTQERYIELINLACLWNGT